jgi:hypothetical protein
VAWSLGLEARQILEQLPAAGHEPSRRHQVRGGRFTGRGGSRG